MSSETATATPVTATANEATDSVPTKTSSDSRLFVGNVGPLITKEEIKDVFKDYEVESIEIPTRKVRDRRSKESTTKPAGYVFVTFGDKHSDELDSIIEKFTDFEIKDRKIRLNYPKEPKVKEEGETSKEKQESKNGSKSNHGSKPNISKSKSAKKPAKKEKIPFDQGEKSTDTLYLNNLDFSIQAKDIYEFFEAEGETIERVSVPFNRLPGWLLKKKEAAGETVERRNKGYAFVKFSLKDSETIDDKVEKFNKKLFKDRELLASVAIDLRDDKAGDNEQA